MNRLNIIGASGHGKVVADIALLNGYEDILFFDDNESNKECLGFPVVGKCTEAKDGEVFVAIGNAAIREKYMDYYSGRVHPILIHPKAIVANKVFVGEGTVIMAGAVINPDVAIGRGVIVNTSSSIDHDCFLGDYVHVAVGAHLCGTVNVGNKVWIGAGATISNNIRICDGSIVGAGAVVLRDINQAGTYVGVPAALRE